MVQNCIALQAPLHESMLPRGRKLGKKKTLIHVKYKNNRLNKENVTKKYYLTYSYSS